MYRFKTLFLTFFTLSLFGATDGSIIPYMDQPVLKNLEGKISYEQLQQIACSCPENPLRIMSFNMLFNCYDNNLEQEDRWESRGSRVAEYILYAHPDVIGSQELQNDQLQDLLTTIGSDYGYFGVEEDFIFYRKQRVELLKAETYYFPNNKNCNHFTLCHFKDRRTRQQFFVINTHLAFGDIERRNCEAHQLRDFLLQMRCKLPLFVTGDFNTFAFRQQLDLPFYDGDNVVRIIEEAGVRDGMRLALFGHFGPISTTNFCPEKRKPFCSMGEPGVILDHIFVGGPVQVVVHGIDPAKVEGHYPSDHFPVIVDVVLTQPRRG